jgi:phage baseplate assembly protein W
VATYDIDSYDNINDISDVSVGIVVSTNSFDNTQQVNSIAVQFVISPATYINENIVNPPFSIDKRYFASLDTFTNANTIGDFAINDNKLLQTFINEQVFGETVAAHNMVIGDIGNFESYPSFGLPIVVSHPYNIPVSITPVTRNPFASITSSEIGLRKFRFRDLSSSFLSHPITGDITTVTDFNAVAQSIKNIILTNKTERHFSDINFGVGIESYLFKLHTEIEAELQENILRQISTHEPRAIINGIDLEVFPERHQLAISISYGIKTYDQTDSIKLFLERA